MRKDHSGESSQHLAPRVKGRGDNMKNIVIAIALIIGIAAALVIVAIMHRRNRRKPIEPMMISILVKNAPVKKFSELEVEDEIVIEDRNEEKDLILI